MKAEIEWKVGKGESVGVIKDFDHKNFILHVFISGLTYTHSSTATKTLYSLLSYIPTGNNCTAEIST